MMFLTHLLFGILSGYISRGFLGYGSSLLFLAVAAAASSLPDIDHVSSKIGRKLPPFAVIINFIFHHRGFMHSVFPPLLLYFMLRQISPLVAAAVLVGYVSHLLLDATTTNGIRFLYLLPFRVRGFVRTNSFMEKIIALLLIAAIALTASKTLYNIN